LNINVDDFFNLDAILNDNSFGLNLDSATDLYICTYFEFCDQVTYLNKGVATSLTLMLCSCRSFTKCQPYQNLLSQLHSQPGPIFLIFTHLFCPTF